MLIGFKIIGFCGFLFVFNEAVSSFAWLQFNFWAFHVFLLLSSLWNWLRQLVIFLCLRIEFFIEHRFSASIINCFLKAVEFALRNGFWFETHSKVNKFEGRDLKTVVLILIGDPVQSENLNLFECQFAAFCSIFVQTSADSISIVKQCYNINERKHLVMSRS